VFHIADREHRRFVGDFDTREEAEARLAKLLAEDPAAEGILVIERSGMEPPDSESQDTNE
jgi:hypothetical protein